MATFALAPRESLAIRKRGMKITVHPENSDPVLLCVEGRVSQRDVELEDPLIESLGEHAYSRRVVADLSEGASLESSGVNWLLVSQKRMQEHGGKLVLHSLSPIANNVLKVLNLHAVFQIADSQAAAIRKLGEDA